MSTDPTREELIQLCSDGVVTQAKWHDRDSASAQRQLGECGALLRSGCAFSLRHEADTWWVYIDFQGFNYFEWGVGEGHLDSDMFYVPTRERLDRRKYGDWY